MDYQLTTTTGGAVTTGGTLDANGNYVCGYYYVYPIYMPTEPTHCMGKAHVFECDHERKCKCGSVERLMAADYKNPKGGKKKC
jgi:hypothetical protein